MFTFHSQKKKKKEKRKKKKRYDHFHMCDVMHNHPIPIKQFLGCQMMSGFKIVLGYVENNYSNLTRCLWMNPCMF